MTITIHRGTHQIGGCATEICAGNTRIFIDMGSELPGEGGAQPEETMSIPGVTEGVPRCDGVFFTHSHGDHIGQLERILPGVPLYMGETARELCLILNRHLTKAGVEREKTIAALERAHTFVAPRPVTVGDIRITPFFIDHSAFDAYMFLIEAEGKKLLHTGDFRLHGFRGGKTPEMLEKYVGRVDWLICEGTMLSRDDKTPRSEHKLQEDERKIMEENKRVFVLCSSMNIDRIAAFIKAKPDDRPTVCDNYQKDVLKCVESRHGDKTPLYRFGELLCNQNNLLHDQIEEKGCLAFIRTNKWSEKLLEWFDEGLSEENLIVYSMWDGYLSGRAQNERIVSFLNGRKLTCLHTSGHVAEKDIVKVCDTVDPRQGLIPIHSEAPERFKELFPQRNVLLPGDGEVITL